MRSCEARTLDELIPSRGDVVYVDVVGDVV
jgi:hypothetical protein